MSVFKMAEYKKAKLMVSQLEKVIKIVEVCEASLSGYIKYRPVRNILTTIKEEKFFLNLALDEYKIILQTKGETR